MYYSDTLFLHTPFLSEKYFQFLVKIFKIIYKFK